MALSVAPLIAVAVAAPASAQIPETGVGSAKVVPLQVTGPPANRFNLVIAGDGYTEAEMPKFRAQIDKHLNVMWSIEPYKSYRSYINVYAIEIISGESGIDCDPGLDAPRRETPLSMGFWGGCNANSAQRLISVNNTALRNYTNLAPGVSQRLAIANSDTYGGAGGANATASGGNSLSALISPHEIGHSLGGLQDEYDYYQRGVPGDCYSDGEPSSAHHTLLSVDAMRTQQRKWWRWLGEPSEAGGLIDRYEGGLYFARCVWRPSRHSIMKTLGYYYDQVSREIMTQRIASRVNLVEGSTPTSEPVGRTDTVWVETLHPVDHELNVTWTLDGTAIPNSANRRSLKLSELSPTPGTHTLSAKIVDPTPFVRDPAIQDSNGLTRTLTWTIKDAANPPGATEPATITGGTPTDRPVGRTHVVYVETSHPADGRVPTVSWKLDGATVPNPDNSRNFRLADHNLTSGTHTLSASVGDQTRTWEVDATDAVTALELSTPTAIVSPSGAEMPEYLFEGPFSIKLTATDDKPGYVVPEFRVDGDGWRNYYGWPTDANAPFRFSVTGTDIDLLNYGQLDYGRHIIEYRAIDAAGNLAAPKKIAVTYLDPDKNEVAPVGGTVPATLSLTFGAAPATFGTFTPGLAKDYTASIAADVVSTAGDAALSVSDPDTTRTGRLVNGSFVLAQPLEAQASSPAGTGRALAPVGGTDAPTGLLNHTTPTSHDPVTLGFRQRIGATEPLRTGSYSKTLTFTLSTTNP